MFVVDALTGKPRKIAVWRDFEAKICQEASHAREEVCYQGF